MKIFKTARRSRKTSDLSIAPKWWRSYIPITIYAYSTCVYKISYHRLPRAIKDYSPSTHIALVDLFWEERARPGRYPVYSAGFTQKERIAPVLRAYKARAIIYQVVGPGYTGSSGNQLRKSRHNPDCARKSDIGCLNFYVNPHRARSLPANRCEISNIHTSGRFANVGIIYRIHIYIHTYIYRYRLNTCKNRKNVCQ